MTVTSRSERGSRANKRLRDSGRVPGVIYGHKQDVLAVSMDRREVTHHLAKGAHVFDLTLNGKSETVLVKDVQYDHLGDEVLHIDFNRVSVDERVKVSVPIELKGTPKEAEGGVLTQVLANLEVECLVLEIPEAIRHNVTDMKLNDVLHVKDLVLPPGVTALQDPELIVATVREVKEVLPVVPETVEGAAAEPEVIGRKAAEEEGAEAAEAAAPAKGAATAKPAKEEKK
jgi:large subunit ribosomal protein L25